MGSRIRENVKHLFQCFCEVAGPQAGSREAWIVQKFPDMYKDEEVLKSVPKFAFPCEVLSTVVQHFSFVLTSIDSKWTFGFCRHDPKTGTALVVLSFLPWHESFYKLLNHISEIKHSPNAEEDLIKFLTAVYSSNVPDPGTTLQVPFNNGESAFICQCPNQFQLPKIPENRNLTEYYNAVDGHNMMIVFASMLYERRIIFTSKRLSRLSACVQSANAIIYPMNWQHIFIPVLPLALMDYLLAPMPYLIGVPESILERTKRSDLGEVVILDADNNTIETPFQDLESLPSDVVNSLRRRLRNSAALLGDGVPRAFLQALVLLIGGYRDALRFQQGQKITFSQEAFIESRPANMQPFLRKMLQLQIFQQFIEERLEMLNSGLGFSDEFEMEACNYSGKSSSKLKQQYKEWTYTMKKEGSAFFKTVKNKANPAMKSAVKSVKERGKDVRTAYKGIRSKWRDIQPKDVLSTVESVDDFYARTEKPQSAPTSPTIQRRPQTMTGSKASLKATVSYRKDITRSRKISNETWTKPYCALSPSSDASSPEFVVDKSHSTTPGLQLSPLDMNLMGDMQEIIQKCNTLLDFDDQVSPPVDRTLKPVRSLESFKHSDGSGNDNDWVNPSVPFLIAPQRKQNDALAPSPNKTPPNIPPRTICPQLFPSNGYDIFGATPFVMSDNSFDGDSVFLVASPSSVDMVRLPPPAHNSSSRKCKAEDETDLIRLGSTPSEEEFDPLVVQEIERNQHTFKSSSNLNIEGLANPLYPYFVPISKSVNQSGTSGNKSFLYSSETVNLLNSSRSTSEMNSLTHNSKHSTLGTVVAAAAQPTTNNQDLALLKEYGLDFNNLSTCSVFDNNSHENYSNKGSESLNNPFDSLITLSDPKMHNISQSQWTKFE